MIVVSVALVIGAVVVANVICLVMGIIRMAQSGARQRKADLITRAMSEALARRNNEGEFFK